MIREPQQIIDIIHCEKNKWEEKTWFCHLLGKWTSEGEWGNYVKALTAKMKCFLYVHHQFLPWENFTNTLLCELLRYFQKKFVFKFFFGCTQILTKENSNSLSILLLSQSWLFSALTAFQNQNKTLKLLRILSLL